MASRRTYTVDPFSSRTASGLSTPLSFASNVPECCFTCSTENSLPPIRHAAHRGSAACASSTLIHPRTPYEPATRPISSSFLGGFLAKLLHEARRRRRKLSALASPMLHALHVHAQRLAALRRFRIVEPEPLDELLARRAPRIGHHHMEERPLVRAAALQSNHHHREYSANREKARIIRYKSELWEAWEASNEIDPAAARSPCPDRLRPRPGSCRRGNPAVRALLRHRH